VTGIRVGISVGILRLEFSPTFSDPHPAVGIVGGGAGEEAMRTQQIQQFLNEPGVDAHRIRCTSGAEYLIHDQSQWWFMRDQRVLMIVVDGRTTAALDPMLVECIVSSNPEQERVTDERDR
jgi:hypothetical protein